MTAAHTLVTHEQLDCLLSKGGKPRFGHFDLPPRSLGSGDFPLHNEMDKPVSRLGRHFSFKQFEFVAIHTPRYVLGLAIADIRYLGSGFCYLYDKSAAKLYQKQWLRPPVASYQLGESPWQGESAMGPVHFYRDQGLWRVLLDTDIQGRQVRAELELRPMPLSLPMALCSPTGYSGWTYTQKHNALAVGGSLSVNHEPQPLGRALAGYDFSAGYMRRETSWRWASINAWLGEHTLGLNLAAGVNETGSSENVLWLDGVRQHLSPVHFDFDRHAGEDGLWRIWSERSELELSFRPEACRKEKLNLGLLKSNFRQYLGHFDGWVVDTQGKKHQLKAVPGLTEDHFAKW
ncbi:DUF2804 domain-containing protein [Shewanella cyperi]|uniref:DUF2804 domain-containing protein n=1 Tax=Shewanella cyperi TaxID=2814292 RepID=UPI001D18CB5D|nr:DUF2804 domain-containing protein [Shewanella cyperi]